VEFVRQTIFDGLTSQEQETLRSVLTKVLAKLGCDGSHGAC
jgi:DNA-binding MarR family transcriptional regulator